MLMFLSLKQFLRDLRSQKLRTLMTMFGIMWGTVSIILLMAFGTGMQKHNVKKFKGLGEYISIIWPGRTSQEWEGLPKGRRIRISEDDIVRMKQSLKSIKAISPEFTSRNVPFKSLRNNMVVSLSGVWPEFGDMRNLIPQEGGRFLSDKDMAEKRRVIFIGDELAEKMFPGEDAVGQSVQVRGVPFVVVGVMITKEQDSSYGGRDKRNAYIPSSTYRGMYTRRYPSNTIVQAHNQEGMELALSDIYKSMSGKYKFDPDDTEALSIWDTTETIQFFNNFFMAFRVFLVSIGCLTLITGGIGVTNIMNVVLEERTKEIGIKMALGAKKNTILFQFMFETILLTLMGGLIGFAIGIVIVKLFPLMGMTKELGTPVLDFYGGLMTVGILGVIALLAGFFPARRAASQEPVKALKLF